MTISIKNINTKSSDLSKYINVFIITNNNDERTKKVSSNPILSLVNLKISRCKNIFTLKAMEITAKESRLKIII